MPGVNGAIKLNSVAPSNKNTETNKKVSVFDVQEEVIITTKKQEEKPVQESIVKTIEKVQKEELIIEKPKPAIEIKEIDYRSEFAKITKIVKSLYEKVFSKSQGFKPTYEETVGDLILYLSAKLKQKGLNEGFDKAFSISQYDAPKKYTSAYVPYAIKLASWCENKKILTVTDSLMFEITALYKACFEQGGKVLTEEELSSQFLTEINYLYKI